MAGRDLCFAHRYFYRRNPAARIAERHEPQCAARDKNLFLIEGKFRGESAAAYATWVG
jgi:hypothetical protein